MCECLKNYLKVRGNCKPEDPLFIGREGTLNGKSVSTIIHDLIVSVPELAKIPGFKPTSLRDAFEDALVDSETYHKTKEALIGHISNIEQEYGGYSKMVSRLMDAMKKAYPLLCLNDALCNGNSIVLTLEANEKLKVLLDNYDELMGVAKLMKEGKLVHINDPDLVPRLKTEGIIK